MQSMSLLKRINDAFALVLTLVAASCLATLTVLVFYGVVMRYVFNNAPDFVEPIALLMVVAIAMFGAALKVREGGHIGLDSFVERLPAGGKRAAHVLQKLCLIAFAVVTETIFSWPGMGKLLIDSIVHLDRPVVVAYLIVVVLVLVLISLIVDILYSVLDPRVRLGDAK